MKLKIIIVTILLTAFSFGAELTTRWTADEALSAVYYPSNGVPNYKVYTTNIWISGNLTNILWKEVAHNYTAAEALSRVLVPVDLGEGVTGMAMSVNISETSLTGTLDNVYLNKSGDTAGSLTVTNLTLTGLANGTGNKITNYFSNPLNEFWGVVHAYYPTASYINDSVHAPYNLTNIYWSDSYNGKLTIVQNRNANRCGTFLAVPDEEMAAKDVECGTSVGTEVTHIYYFKPAQMTAWVYYDGTEWTLYAVSNCYGFADRAPYRNVTKSDLVWQTDHLRIEHIFVGQAQFNQMRSYMFAYSLEQVGAYKPIILRTHHSASNGYVDISFQDIDGNVITTPSTEMSFYITKSGGKRQYSNESVPGNTWLWGKIAN